MPDLQHITPAQFQRIAAIARENWGLALNQQKIQLVSSRLHSHLRHTPFRTIEDYLGHLECGATESDLLVFFDVLSTNVTSFFRDRSHFDYLERELFTALARGNLSLPGKRLRLWSAGCSTGCEPYTMALVAASQLRKSPGWDVRILATDLSNFAVEEARAGAYTADVVKGLPPDLLRTYFERRGDRWVVGPELRGMVAVGQLNLMGHWPMRGPFDVIFCRNVMIYFDAPTRERLVRRFSSLLRPGGYFAVGSAETLAGMDVDLKPVLPSMYVK